MDEAKKGVFETLYALNVNDNKEKKKVSGKELDYLSWTWAWAEVKKLYPDIEFSIWRDEKGLPYVYDPETGYMVFTSVHLDGVTHEMWLPVMDGGNNAMKSKPYSFKTKNDKTVNVNAATMFDINKTIMRCLVKNLAMFGLGLYIYAGEDLPEGDEDDKAPAKAPEKATLVCEKCKKEIPAITKDGKVIRTPEQIVEFTKKTHGKCLCWKCSQEFAREKAEANEADNP